MKKTAKEIKENIIKNTSHLIQSREETKLSFSERSGITRSTVYKILNGEVKNVQQNTVEKIANFFGVSVKLLEESDIALIEANENSSYVNANPISIPIIKENQVYNLYKENLSKLISDFPITYCYTKKKNIIGIQLEKDIKPYFKKGEILVVRRFFQGDSNELLIVLNNKNIEIKQKISSSDILVGHIIEERLSEEI